MTQPIPDPRWWRSVTEPNEWVKCEVCEQNNAVTVCSVPGIPYSAAYCGQCLDAHAHPYWLVVRNTALIGGLDDAADWWKQMVSNTLAHLNKSAVDFAADVAEDHLQQVNRMYAEAEMGGDPCPHQQGWKPLGDNSQTCPQCGAIRESPQIDSESRLALP